MKAASAYYCKNCGCEKCFNAFMVGGKDELRHQNDQLRAELDKARPWMEWGEKWQGKSGFVGRTDALQDMPKDRP